MTGDHLDPVLACVLIGVLWPVALWPQVRAWVKSRRENRRG